MGTKSAVRSARKAQGRRRRTQTIQSAVKTAVSQARQMLAAGDETAPQTVARAVRTLDRAASKGVVHRNKAARYKSRLVRAQNQRSGAK